MKSDIIDFTNFLATNEDLSNTIKVGIALQSGEDIDGNPLTVEEYKNELESFIIDVNSFDQEIQIPIKTVFGIDDSGNFESEIDEAIELSLIHI